MMWEKLGVLLVTALLFSCVGFKNYVWFMSIGYGLAVAAMGAVLLMEGVTGSLQLTAGFVVLCVLLLGYGLRLSGFLIHRERKSAAYRKTLEKVSKTQSGKPMPLVAKIALWVSVCLLYTAEVSPVLFRGMNGDGSWAVSALIALVGLIMEAVADWQKSAYKKTDPHSPAMKGLYKLVRCPNYLGEMIFWTGIWVSGFHVNATASQWVVSTAGYLLILYVMFSGARRLEARQNRNYGDRSDYREYCEHTPILLPFIPLYHLSKDLKHERG